MNYYTVYRNKDDSIAATGTAKECAKALKLTLGSFYSMISRLTDGRNRKYTVVMEECDDDG